MIIIMILMGIGAFVIFRTKSVAHLTKISEERLKDFTESNSYSTNQELSRTRELLSTIAEAMNDFENVQPEEALRYLRNVENNTSFISMYIADEYGNARSGNGASEYVGNEAFFERSAKGETVIDSFF